MCENVFEMYRRVVELAGRWEEICGRGEEEAQREENIAEMRREVRVEPKTVEFMRDERAKLVRTGGWMYSLIVDRDSQPGRNT